MISPPLAWNKHTGGASLELNLAQSWKWKSPAQSLYLPQKSKAKFKDAGAGLAGDGLGMTEKKMGNIVFEIVKVKFFLVKVLINDCNKILY